MLLKNSEHSLFFDIMITDVTDDDLKDDISKQLNHPYLAQLKEDEQ